MQLLFSTILAVIGGRSITRKIELIDVHGGGHTSVGFTIGPLFVELIRSLKFLEICVEFE